MQIDILAFAAHPDDVEISAGGTLLKYASEGKKIVIVDLTQGELGTRGMASIRMDESKIAAEKLQLFTRVNLGLRDCFFEESESTLEKIIQEIRHFKPKIVLANSIKDRHPDHARASKLVERACFLAALPKIETIKDDVKQIPYRIPILMNFIQDYYINPDFVIDVTPFMEAKLDLVKSYSSQFYNANSSEPETPISGPHFFEFLKGRMMEFGRPIGVKYAEGFTVNRIFGVKDLFQLF